MDHQGEGVDRISSLPRHVLHHILSFLDSPQDLDITSGLSKEWKMIWGSFPIFDFDTYSVERTLRRRQYANPGGHPQDLMAVAGESLMTSADYRLDLFRRQRDDDASSFTLKIYPRPADVPLVDEWIRIMVDKNVREIHLRMGSFNLPRGYTLPDTILSATRLTSLTLDYCNLPVNFMNHDFPINSLTSLTLNNIILSDQALQKLTVVYPSIRELFLYHCSGYTRFILPSLRRLVKVELCRESAEVIQLDAPELRHLSYQGIQVEDISFNLSSCNSNLKTLHIHNSWVVLTSSFPQLVASCTVLEEFSLDVGSLEDNFILTSFSLKKLTLGRCKNIQEIRINAPSLEFFSYKGEPCETTFVLTSQTAKWEAHVEHDWDDYDVASYFISVNYFLHRTVQFKALHMTFGSFEVDVEALNHVQRNNRPILELDEMVVSYDHFQLNNIQIFAAVFRCFNPLSLTIELDHCKLQCEERDALFRYIYEQLQGEEDHDWEMEVRIHILAGNESHHTQWFASIEGLIHELPALGHVHEVCFKTQRVERVKKNSTLLLCL